MVSLQTKIKFKANFYGLNTNDWVIEKVDLIENTITSQSNSYKIRDGALFDWNLEKILGLPVMWFVAPESITHLFE